MALQGTLETFALPDVLRLLASTHKTGQLRVSGGRGSGSVWLAEGSIVGGEAGPAQQSAAAGELLFELLRFEEGEFIFDADATGSPDGDPAEVEATLGEAETMLAEWKTIEAVVPSLSGWITLRPELAADEVTLDADRWSQIVTISGGTTVAWLGEALGLGELPASRTVKELIELGLVELGDAPAPSEAQAAAAPDPVADFVTLDEMAAGEAGADGGGDVDLGPEGGISFDANRFDTASLVMGEASHGASTEPAHGDEDDTPAHVADVGDAEAEADVAGDESADGGLGDLSWDDMSDDLVSITDPDLASSEPAAEPSLPDGVSGTSAADDLTDAAEIARQLANLSPKAARAVAAAAKATTEEEREAALADVDDEEEPINRGLLLKFLGSVNG